jgi:hypothetical protein
MATSESLPTKSRQALLDELASLTTIERGTLFEEYRQRAAAAGSSPIQLGPYFKHQSWVAGKNHSSRVAPHEVEALRLDLEHGKRFAQITAELADLAIAQSRENRKALTPKAAIASEQALVEKKTPPRMPP